MKNNGRRPTIATMPTEMRRCYWVWASMIQRCHTPENSSYRRYGAKGISVCSRWRTSFDAFFADMGIPPVGHTLERQDSTKNYDAGNCIWASRITQSNNRPSWCKYYELNGERLSMKQAWQKYANQSVTYRAFVKRLQNRGWPIDRALSAPRDIRGGLRNAN